VGICMASLLNRKYVNGKFVDGGCFEVIVVVLRQYGEFVDDGGRMG